MVQTRQLPETRSLVHIMNMDINCNVEQDGPALSLNR